jgi:hypothetical protein
LQFKAGKIEEIIDATVVISRNPNPKDMDMTNVSGHEKISYPADGGT